MKIPTSPIGLMKEVYRKILPIVHNELKYWKKRAEQIPNDELRKQALASIENKTFHCEGGAILSLLSKSNYKEVIKFIVAYQTISDYLDNLCDRSTSLDPDDFSCLHESMKDALALNDIEKNYYCHRSDQNDGNYLRELVAVCQGVLKKMEHYDKICPFLLELCGYYCDLQIHKHVKADERVPRLKKWFSRYKNKLPEMEWYEFSACSGSTLGIFSLVSYGFAEEFKEENAEKIVRGYFPYIQGLHILLDYLIDQEEDRLGGDLNFCFYYEDENKLFRRLEHFIQEADKHTEELPNKDFHRLINRGLLGIYLSDEKVQKQKSVRTLAKKLIRDSGLVSLFFYLNGKMYRKMKKGFLSFNS